MSAVLPIRAVEKPWGREHLPAPFGNPGGKKIGEIWFEPPATLDQLLVKYIFTSDKLSVQVHPSDTQTLAAGLGRQGKEECWLVIDAQPGATLGIGFRDPIDSDAMRAAARDGSIEDLLAWHPVRASDFYYIPANTVHAIGAGVSLIEVQQNSDITYRLYDYGRPRELHLDESIAVAKGVRYSETLHRKVADQVPQMLVDGPVFRLDQVVGLPACAVAERYRGPVLVIPRSDNATIAGEAIKPGSCGIAPSLDAIDFDPAGSCLIAQPFA